MQFFVTKTGQTRKHKTNKVNIPKKHHGINYGRKKIISRDQRMANKQEHITFKSKNQNFLTIQRTYKNGTDIKCVEMQ